MENMPSTIEGRVRTVACAVLAAGGLAVLWVGGMSSAYAEQSSIAIPDDRVVARLGPAGQNYSEAVRQALETARREGNDETVAQRSARELVAAGKSAGDPRLVGAALGILRPWLSPEADAETLLIAADARQYQHDFEGALDLLNQAVTDQPDSAAVLITRATIRIVRGELDRAQGDCGRLYDAGHIPVGFICESSISMLTGEAETVYKRLSSLTASGALAQAGLDVYGRSLMGEIAVLLGDADSARRHFQTVLESDPDALRERLLLADVELADGRAAVARDLLNDVPEIDGVLLRRALAARQLGEDDTVARIADELDRRFQQNIDLGLTAHAREEARFYLYVADRPALALERARVNWEMQHEVEDAQLLLAAADAAGAPEAAVPVLDWVAAQGVSIPTLTISDAVREARR